MLASEPSSLVISINLEVVRFAYWNLVHDLAGLFIYYMFVLYPVLYPLDRRMLT